MEKIFIFDFKAMLNKFSMLRIIFLNLILNINFIIIIIVKIIGS